MLLETMLTPRYPQIHVRVRSANPLALVGAVRYALRRAGIERPEIRRFSEEAFDEPSPDRQREVCRHWVRVDNAVDAGAGR